MPSEFEAIFLDLGNTLRILLKDEAHQARARQEMVRLVGAPEDPDAFCQEIDRRYKAYRKWATEHRLEAPEAELWTRWLLPDYPVEKVAPLATELTFQYRQSMGRRVVQEDGRAVVLELHRRGYVLGIISNVITSQEIPDWLARGRPDPLFQVGRPVVCLRQAQARSGHLPRGCAAGRGGAGALRLRRRQLRPRRRRHARVGLRDDHHHAGSRGPRRTGRRGIPARPDHSQAQRVVGDLSDRAPAWVAPSWVETHA